jgi:CrcB protein
MAYLLAAAGGAIGALGRWALSDALPATPGTWPWATLLVNLTGCLLIGVLTGALAARDPEPPWARPLLAVGLLGGWTTYSAFAVEVVRADHLLLAAGYVLVSVVGGVLATAGGVLAARRGTTP